MAGEIKAQAEGTQEICKLFKSFHQDWMSKLSSEEIEQQRYTEQFLNEFPCKLVAEVMSFQTHYFSSDIGSQGVLEYIQYLTEK